MLVVDDRSPDGTAAAVRRLPAFGDRVRLLEGEKRGLGAAYVRGIRYALERMGAEVVVQMDADFSHDPRQLPQLLAHIGRGGDLVIGSRYIRGGRILHWDRRRRLLSRLGNLLARGATGMVTVRDCTSGYRAIRASVLRQIPLERIRVQGYAFQVALLLRARLGGAAVREYPIHFAERVEGHSKLGWRDILEFALHIGWMLPGAWLERRRGLAVADPW